MHGFPSIESVILSVGNRDIPVRISGSGQPLLLLHGYPLDGRMWDRLVPLLARDHLCVAPDFRGFGRCAEEDFSFSMADLADDCCKMLDTLQIRQPAVVCGLSMGGYVAMQLVERHAARLAGLVLSNTRANADDDLGVNARHASAKTALMDGVGSVVTPMLGKMLSPHTVQYQPQVVELVRAMMVGTCASTIAWAQLAMATRLDFRLRMRDWKLPVICVAGAEDTIAPIKVMEEMSQDLPNSEMQVVENSAHLTPLERPDEFAAIVRNATNGWR